MTNNFQENDLLQLLIDQNTVAVNKFVTAQYMKLKKTVSFSGIAMADHDDLIQETFITFFSKLTDFQEKSKITTFLWGIFYNKLREARRKSKKTPTPIAEIFADNTDQDIFDPRGHWLSQVQVQNPESWENYSQLSDIIQSCLEKLPFMHKQVIILYLSSTMDKSEICHNLDLNDTNYRQCLSRGRKSLRLCIDDQFREGAL